MGYPHVLGKGDVGAIAASVSYARCGYLCGISGAAQISRQGEGFRGIFDGCVQVNQQQQRINSKWLIDFLSCGLDMPIP